jgi:DNA-binding beta-propeller fold protein YncE
MALASKRTNAADHLKVSLSKIDGARDTVVGRCLNFETGSRLRAFVQTVRSSDDINFRRIVLHFLPSGHLHEQRYPYSTEVVGKMEVADARVVSRNRWIVFTHCTRPSANVGTGKLSPKISITAGR